VDLSIKKDLIEPLITKKLRINAAYDMDLGNDPVFLSKYEQYQMRMVGQKYFEKVIFDEIIGDDMIEEYISRQAIEIKASHILIGYEKSPRVVKRTLEESKTIAIDVKKQLDDGRDFTELAEKYSDDPSVKKNRGDLGYFTWGRMVGPFQQAAWDMEIGEISDPVKTQFGYHIIRLDDRKEVANYVENRSKENITRIKQTIARSFGDSVRVLWKKHYKELCEDNNYQIYEEEINKFADTLKVIIKNKPLTPEVFTPEQRQITFAEWDDDKITVQTFIDKHDKQLAQIFGSFRDGKVMKKEIDRMSMDSQVLEDAGRLGIRDDDDIVNALRSFKENHIEKEAEKKYTLNKVEVSEEETVEYYQSNLQRFEKPAEIEIWVIDLKDEQLARQIASKAKQGQNFENLAKKYSEDKRSKSKGGYLGYKANNARGSISFEAHKIGPGGKIGGPVQYGRFWSVIKTGKRHDKSIKPFEEVNARIKNLVKNEKRKEVKIVWENELKEKYEVVIDDDKLENI